MSGIIASIRAAWKKIAVAAVIGIVVSVIMQRRYATSIGVFASNAFFSVGMTFLLAALFGLVSNLGVFNSVVFSGKTVMKVLRNDRKKPGEESDYADYVISRKKRGGVAVLFLFAVLFLMISALTALVFS